jgi:hypothetical protein
MKTENQQKVIEFLASKNSDIDFAHHLGHNDFASFDEIRDILQDNSAFDVEIIYYSTAIDYLQKNDPSLRESMGLASEMGFSLDKLNSEVLASILASEYARNDFEELEREVSDLIEELLEEEENEEEN